MIVLSNGTKVANFSSPHPFTFTDGTVLPAHSPETANLLKVNFIEDIDSDGDVSLTFTLSTAVVQAMNAWTNEWREGRVDKVLVPRPMIEAMKQDSISVKNSPFRGVRMEDRVKKLVSIEKWCI